MLLFFILTLGLMGPYAVLLMIGRGYHRLGRFYWSMVARWCLLATIVVRGNLTERRPLLLVSNHVSYVDIVILGAIIEGSFVAKSEVRKWPGIGILARLGRTVFVDRRPRSAGTQSSLISQRLRSGEPLILFPEGTSSDGNRVLPFKSALFSVAAEPIDNQSVVVQPMSIAYTRANGLPMGYAGRPFYAWYGDMDLASHLWELMRRGSFQVEVDFLSATTMLAQDGNRKVLCRYCEDAVRQGHGGAITGRIDREPTLTLPSI